MPKVTWPTAETSRTANELEPGAETVSAPGPRLQGLRRRVPTRAPDGALVELQLLDLQAATTLAAQMIGSLGMAGNLFSYEAILMPNTDIVTRVVSSDDGKGSIGPWSRRCAMPSWIVTNSLVTRSSTSSSTPTPGWHNRAHAGQWLGPGGLSAYRRSKRCSTPWWRIQPVG